MGAWDARSEAAWAAFARRWPVETAWAAWEARSKAWAAWEARSDAAWEACQAKVVRLVGWLVGWLHGWLVGW